MSKRFLIIIAVLFLGFVGFLVFSKEKTNSPGSNTNVQASNHVVGAGKKSVTLVEYGDFECSACYAYYPVLKEVKKKYGDDITFQFRNFPLTQIHKQTMAAHRAAEAAAKQNKFWEMHDLLYEQQRTWAASTNVQRIFEDYATQLGLNVDQFKKDYSSAEIAAVINADIDAGNKFNINSTPSFVINGKKIENPKEVTLDGFSKIIDEYLKN